MPDASVGVLEVWKGLLQNHKIMIFAEVDLVPRVIHWYEPSLIAKLLPANLGVDVTNFEREFSSKIFLGL